MNGIVLPAEDATILARAKNAKLQVVVDKDRPFAFEKTLFAEPGVLVPWDLLPAAWNFLSRWDAAIPLWRYGMTASDVGTQEERKSTQAIVRDLRVLLHSWELLFVARTEAGCALIETWKREFAGGGDKRLAFLRAFYQVKPRVCVLPTSWLANIRSDSAQALARGRVIPARNTGRPLVKVELSPGRFVKCRPGDEEKVREQFRRQRAAGVRR